MKTMVILYVFFIVDGSVQYMDGWFPREQPSMEICESRRLALDEYLNEYNPYPYKFTTLCNKVEVGI